MKSVCSGAVFALVVTLSSFVGAAQSAVVQARPVQSAPVTTTLKGVIKQISDASLVLTPSNNKNAEVTFQLTAAAKRTGAVAAGDQVSVTYYYENGQRVVTAVTGKESK